MTARHPTIEECEAAGRGPSNWPGKPYEVGGLPDTPEERARFEAYMRGHCWDVGRYIEQQRSYDTMFVRCCYGVWRDRGALPTTYGVAPAPQCPKGCGLMGTFFDGWRCNHCGETARGVATDQPTKRCE